MNVVKIILVKGENVQVGVSLSSHVGDLKKHWHLNKRCLVLILFCYINILPHVKGRHQPHDILPVFRKFKFGDFWGIEIRWIVFLQQEIADHLYIIATYSIYHGEYLTFPTQHHLQFKYHRKLYVSKCSWIRRHFTFAQQCNSNSNNVPQVLEKWEYLISTKSMKSDWAERK